MRVFLFSAGIGLGIPAGAWAGVHTTGVPELSSRPGATYTIYVNPAGFNFTGVWNPSNGQAQTPGVTPALNDVASTGSFNAAEQTQIKVLWSRLAQSYSGFDVNVTTIDPAIAAGQSATDALRQAYYDATPNMMHTVIGSQVRPAGTPGVTPNNKWFSDGADGVSPGVGVVAGVAPDVGAHTNWMFSEDQAGANTGGVIRGEYIGGISAHENGHSFGLFHQSDYNGAANVNEYTFGDDNTGNGSYVGIMGNAADRQHIAWRVGTADVSGTGTLQNDVAVMLSTNVSTNGRAGAADLHFVEDGIGHTAVVATAMPVHLDGTINFDQAEGIIVPRNELNPIADGTSNYTADWFSFTLDGPSNISLTANNSTDFITPGTADGTGSLRSGLSIFAADGVTLLGTGVEDGSTAFTTFTGNLGAGSYFASISSLGGFAQLNAAPYNPSEYYNMGAYFLTGSGFTPVPEPGVLALGGLSALALFRRRRVTGLRAA